MLVTVTVTLAPPATILDGSTFVVKGGVPAPPNTVNFAEATAVLGEFPKVLQFPPTAT